MCVWKVNRREDHKRTTAKDRQCPLFLPGPHSCCFTFRLLLCCYCPFILNIGVALDTSPRPPFKLISHFSSHNTAPLSCFSCPPSHKFFQSRHLVICHRQDRLHLEQQRALRRPVLHLSVVTHGEGSDGHHLIVDRGGRSRLRGCRLRLRLRRPRLRQRPLDPPTDIEDAERVLCVCFSTVVFVDVAGYLYTTTSARPRPIFRTRGSVSVSSISLQSSQRHVHTLTSHHQPPRRR